MASLTGLIQNHLAYATWATTRLLDAVEKLSGEQLNHDFGSADKSIKGTLVHLFRAERTWLVRVEQANTNNPWGVPADEDWPALRARWAEVQRRWQDWAAGLSEPDADRILAYTDLKGNAWAQPVWQIVLHVVNHGTHHRGQISGFLRASDAPPPPLDFILFMRQKQPK